MLMLTTYNGIPFTTVPQLKALIAQGEVRYAFLDSVCARSSPKTTAGCAPAALWIRAHATDVSRQAGLRGGVLWRLPGSMPPRACGGHRLCAHPHPPQRAARPAHRGPRKAVA